AGAAFKRENFFLAGTLIGQIDVDAVVEEGQLANPLGQNVVVELDVIKNFFIGPEVDFSTALVRITNYLDRRNRVTIDGFDYAILRHATDKFHLMFFAIAANRQL